MFSITTTIHRINSSTVYPLTIFFYFQNLKDSPKLSLRQPTMVVCQLYQALALFRST